MEQILEMKNMDDSLQLYSQMLQYFAILSSEIASVRQKEIAV